MAIKDMTLEELRNKTNNKSISLKTHCGHYSDKNFKIRKVGSSQVYDIAIDVKPCSSVYEETDIIIEPIVPFKKNNNL